MSSKDTANMELFKHVCCVFRWHNLLFFFEQFHVGCVFRWHYNLLFFFQQFHVGCVFRWHYNLLFFFQQFHVGCVFRWHYTIIVFCWGQYEFLWTLKTIFTKAFRLRWILISKVHKNLYWPIQKTVIVLLH
jgi:hypothetical protein